MTPAGRRSAGWSGTASAAARTATVPLLDAAPPAVQERVQQRRLRSLLRHAVENVPFYRGRLGGLPGPADLAMLPVVDRRTVQDAERTGLLDERLDPRTLTAFATSGSSGTKVTVYASDRDLARLRAAYMADLLACGLRPSDRIAYCRVGPFTAHALERFGVAAGTHIRTTASLSEQVDTLLAARATFLVGFPNVLLSMAEELRRRGVTYHGARNVLLGGEGTTPDARGVLAAAFPGSARHEVYACVEAGTIARSCRAGRLHLRRTAVVVEVEADDGTTSVEEGEGEVLVTRLEGTAMPLLRYRLGDRVRISRMACECRSGLSPVVEAVVGRVEDRLLTSALTYVHGDHIIKAAAQPGVLRCQLRQRVPGTADLLVEFRPDAGPDLLERVARAVTVPSDIDVTVHRVSRIPTDVNGKHRLVVSEVGR